MLINSLTFEAYFLGYKTWTLAPASKVKQTGILLAFLNAQIALIISDGMYFDSSIPRGYGVGSSGALVAAIYDRYSLDKVTRAHKIVGLVIEIYKVNLISNFHPANSVTCNSF